MTVLLFPLLTPLLPSGVLLDSFLMQSLVFESVVQAQPLSDQTEDILWTQPEEGRKEEEGGREASSANTG